MTAIKRDAQGEAGLTLRKNVLLRAIAGQNEMAAVCKAGKF